MTYLSKKSRLNKNVKAARLQGGLYQNNVFS